MKLLTKFKSLIILLIIAGSVCFPAKTSDGCFTASVNKTDINVVLPIAELQGLIQQLQDAGNQMVGEAGVQIRQSIDLLSSQIEQRIDQLKNAGMDLINEASAELQAIINDLMNQARLLLKEVDNMIKSNIQCIDYVLAQRIQQIVDAAYGVLDRVDVTIKNAIDRIYIRASMLVDTSTGRIALVVNKTLLLVVKAILLILCFVLLFWLIKTLYKQEKPKSKFWAIGIPIFVVLLIGGGVFLLISKTTLGKILGEQIEVPSWQNSCNDGDNLYTQFITSKNNGAGAEDLKSLGKNALEKLNWCMYATISPEIANEASTKIEEINSVLYPPLVPPVTPQILILHPNPCSPQVGGMFSVHPEWLSKNNMLKIDSWNKLVDKKLLNRQLINVNEFRTNLMKYGTQIVVPESKKSLIYNYKIPSEKIVPKVRIKLQ
jgi:hypothetical protein